MFVDLARDLSSEPTEGPSFVTDNRPASLGNRAENAVNIERDEGSQVDDFCVYRMFFEQDLRGL